MAIGKNVNDALTSVVREFTSSLTDVSKFVLGGVRGFSDLLDRIKVTNIGSRTLTYEEVIAYFVEKRPADPRIAKGAIIREQKCNALIASFVFLDENNQVCTDRNATPYGKRVECRDVDSELAELFGKSDLIVLE